MKSYQWQPIDDQRQLWYCPYYVPGYKACTLAFLSKNKDLLLVSPGAKLVDSLPKELANGKNPTMALVPNAFHHMGVPAWRKKYRDLVVVASDDAIPRLKRKGYTSIQRLSLFKEALPENITLLEPEGMRFGEVWLRVASKEGVAWIVCDAFFNHPKFSNKFITRLIQKLMKAAPGLQISNIVKYFLIKNRGLYKKWLRTQLAKDKPSILIPAHGEILRSPDLPEIIEKLIAARL